MPVEVDLDDVLLTEAAYDAWQVVAERLVLALQTLGRSIDPVSMPLEKARIENDGALTIYVDVPNFGEASLSVPVGQWAYKTPV